MTIPETMKASVLSVDGSLDLDTRPVPQPGPNEVLIQVAAVGVCGSDVHYYRHGRIGDFVIHDRLILGHELAGTIVAVGGRVDQNRVGQRVAVEPQTRCHTCDQCSAGRYNLCPNIKFFGTPPVDGAFCEFVAIDSECAFEMPDSMSFEAGALLEPLSVGIAAARKANVVPGSTVLIAGSGPIGIICAQAARAFGASSIIMSDPVEDRLSKALALGATQGISPAEVPNIEKVDVFIDACGVGPAIHAGILATKAGGTAVLVGMGAAGLRLPVGYIAAHEIQVTGIFRYTHTWPLAMGMVADGSVNLDAMVTGAFTLNEVKQALESDGDPTSMKSIVYPTNLAGPLAGC